MTRPKNVIGGVDTHSSTHHAAVIDLNGRELGDREFQATQAGYDALRRWLCGFGTIQSVGIEGTVSLAVVGLGLAGSVDAGRSVWRVTRKTNCPLRVRFPRYVRAGWSGRR